MSEARKLAAILLADFIGHGRFPTFPAPTGTAPLRKLRSFSFADDVVNGCIRACPATTSGDILFGWDGQVTSGSNNRQASPDDCAMKSGAVDKRSVREVVEWVVQGL